MLRLYLYGFLAGVMLAGMSPAQAGHAVGHAEPQGSAPAHFPADFPVIEDSEWRFRIGGFGGTARGEDPGQPPVIFVHGNTTDHADWYPVRAAFREAGWSDQALWALSYNGLGGPKGAAKNYPNPRAAAEREAAGTDGQSRLTSNDVNVPDMYAFIQAVRSYTGSAEFSLVGHSLGVTVARKTLKEHPELRSDLVAFVGIAGANHGTSLCPPPGSDAQVTSCDEIAAGTDWLAELNGPDGSDETYPPARWLTIYDGTGEADYAFQGEAFAHSPRLDGADNRTFPGIGHNDLRLHPKIVAVYRRFIEQAAPAAK